MTTHMQHSFHVGEWAPALNARVDLAKYHSAAAVMRNFFVDYRGGATTRPGTKYLLQAWDSSEAVRLIPFQVTGSQGYMLEFGDEYIRFFFNGSPILESAINITGATKANPCVLTITQSWSVGDIIFVDNVGGMTQLNDRYFRVAARTGATVTLDDLRGNNINSTAYGTYTAGGTARRVYTISTPWAGDDLAALKFAQRVNTMIFTHPDYEPQQLTFVSAANWQLNQFQIGTTLNTPASVSVATTLAAGTWNYRYAVTAVDENGQESIAATADLLNTQDQRANAGTNTVSWSAVAGALSYNVYKTVIVNNTPVPNGSGFGFIGNCTGTDFPDSNIEADFSQSVPIVYNPFLGAGVASVTVTNGGDYTVRPAVFFSAPGGDGITATGTTTLELNTATVVFGGVGYAIGDTITFANGVVLTVTAETAGTIDPGGVSITNRGNISGTLPGNPVSQISTSGIGNGATFDFTWRVIAVVIGISGAGYAIAPTVSFSAGTAAATATLNTASAGNPSVPAYFQQRLFFAGLAANLQNFYFSQPGSENNFDFSNPINPSDSITGALVANQLNQIRWAIPMPPGLVLMTNVGAWILNGGSAGAAVDPINIVAAPQSYIGAADVCPPIVANFDILFVQAKGSVVRNITYDFYRNIFTGTDITILSSHLFYGHTLLEWTWAEEPYKLVWAVRDDGVLLSCTFMKEQELIGWARHDTDGDFLSVATVTETLSSGVVDTVYVVVERTVEGQQWKYVERFENRDFSTYIVAWCVDSGLRYQGSPATSFTGAEHLAGLDIVGLADGIPFEATVSSTGGFTLASAASTVIAGLAFTPQLQTLQLDVGEPTIQGEVKQISAVTVRVAETLGLSIGRTFDTLVLMKDLTLGQVGSASNEVVTNLTTADAMTKIDSAWTVPGQYCIEQSLPYPASVLGVIPQFVTEKRK